MTKNKANAEIRKTLSQNHIPFWMIAERIGVTEGTIVRWFRTELKPVQRGMVLSAIDSLIEQKK